MKHIGTRREPVEKVIVEDGTLVYSVELTDDEAHIITALLGAMGFNSEVDDGTDTYTLYDQFLRLTGTHGGTQKYAVRENLTGERIKSYKVVPAPTRY